MTAIQTHPFQLELHKEERVIRGEVRIPNAANIPRLPTVIICHGFKGFRRWGFFPYAAETLAQSGFAAVTFDFSMNGVGADGETFTELDRFARNTYHREQEDLAALVQALRQQTLPTDSFDPDRLALLGHSRGGANSLLFALEHSEVTGVVLWNSIAKPDLLSDELKARIRQEGSGTVRNARTGQEMPISREVLDDLEANRERYDLLTRLKQSTLPLLIIQGDKDPAVPVETAHRLAKAAQNHELHILPGADHTFGAVHPFRGSTSHLDRALEQTLSFLKKLLT